MSGAPLLTAVLTQIATLAAASFVVAGAGLAGAVVMLLLVPETLRKHSVDPGQGPPAG
jgi:hypothetical protein